MLGGEKYGEIIIQSVGGICWCADQLRDRTECIPFIIYISSIQSLFKMNVITAGRVDQRVIVLKHNFLL